MKACVDSVGGYIWTLNRYPGAGSEGETGKLHTVPIELVGTCIECENVLKDNR